MSHTFNQPPADVCLMLRAYAEQRWLSGEVTSVLSQLQHPEELPDEQLGAALAYLEVAWIEARRLAAETDAAFADLEGAPARTAETLPFRARGYHATVRALRQGVAGDVEVLLAAPRPELGAEGEDRIGCPAYGRPARIRSAIPFNSLRRHPVGE
jgi:hypothetical protein